MTRRPALIVVIGALLAPASAVAAPRPVAFEVSQDIQTNRSLPAPGGSYSGVPLVAHRTTVVRLYATAPSTTKLVGAELTGVRGRTTLAGSPLASQSGLETVKPGGGSPSVATRGDSRAGFSFALPDSWTTGTITLRGRLLTVSGLRPRLGRSITLRNVRFRSTGTERVLAVKLISSSWQAVPKPKVGLAYPQKLEPLADGAFQFAPNAYAGALDITAIGDATTVGGLVANCSTQLSPVICALPVDKNTKAAAALSVLSGFAQPFQLCKDLGAPAPCPDQIAGIDAAPTSPAPIGQMSTGSLNTRKLSTAMIDALSPQGDAHELGHGIGRNHASGACGASTKSSAFDPWPPDQRGDLNSVGLDLRYGSGFPYGGIYRAIVPRTISHRGSTDVSAPNFNPSEWYDYMSYCPKLRTGPQLDNWISAKGWSLEFSSLRTYGQAHGRVSAGPVAGLHVSGYSVDGGPLIVSRVQPAIAPEVADEGAGLTAVVRSRDGAALAAAPLRADVTHVDEPEGDVPVTMVDGQVPLADLSGAGSLEVDHDSVQLAARARSLHPPTVALTPLPGERAAIAAVPVRWSSSDADGDSLTASVDYSPNGGRTFRTVWSGPSAGAVTIPAGMLTRSANAAVRVRVSDGFDETSAVSAPFREAGRRPDMQITSPVTGQRLRGGEVAGRRLRDGRAARQQGGGETVPRLGDDGELLRLAGSAEDDRFAPLRGRALAWFVDGHRVAFGERATVRVGEGRHVVALVATDRFGRHGLARTVIAHG